MPVLIEQCKEREENVRVQVLTTMSTVFKQTRAAGAAADAGVAAALVACAPAIAEHAAKLLKDKSVKTRHATVTLLKDLNAVKEGLMEAQVAVVVEGLAFALSDKASTSNVKIDTLQLVQKLIASNAAAAFYSTINVSVAAVIGAVGDSFYKITSEALQVCTALVTVLRPDPAMPMDVAFNAPLQQVFECVRMPPVWGWRGGTWIVYVRT
jgi:cullin-associated NEDD8-dissociated protein 1